MRRFFTFAVGYLALALVVASVVGFAGSFFWLFDLCNNFRIQYLVLSLLGLGLALILRSRILLGTFAGVAVCHLVFIAPLYFAPSGDAGEGMVSRKISVMSYNAWVKNDDWESIRSVLEEEESAIIYLTELHPAVQAQLKGLRNEFHIFSDKSDAILVRRDAGLHPQLIGGFAVNTFPGMVVFMEFENVELLFLGIHPVAPLSGGAAGRRDESFDRIASYLERFDELMIVAGDFNATPWSAPFRSLQERTGLVNSQAGFGLQTTWPSYPESSFNRALRIPIDHCLHSPTIKTLSRSVGDAGKSNHHPIRVTLEVPVSR